MIIGNHHVIPKMTKKEAEELKQSAKRSLVKGLLLDHHFLELVADSQDTITQCERRLTQ